MMAKTRNRTSKSVDASQSNDLNIINDTNNTETEKERSKSVENSSSNQRNDEMYVDTDDHARNILAEIEFNQNETTDVMVIEIAIVDRIHKLVQKLLDLGLIQAVHNKEH